MRTKLVIDNTTKWSTRDLRKFLLRGMKAKGVNNRRVLIRYGTNEAHHGWAYLNGRTLQLSLPGPRWITYCLANDREPINYKKLAQVFEHEIDHTLGLKHKDMIDWWTLTPTWHQGLAIHWTETTTTSSPEQRIARRTATVAKREAHARVMLKKAETRLKRAKTIRDKWAKKVRYYDRKPK